jgi:hypothetical protein
MNKTHSEEMTQLLLLVGEQLAERYSVMFGSQRTLKFIKKKNIGEKETDRPKKKDQNLVVEKSKTWTILEVGNEIRKSMARTLRDKIPITLPSSSELLEKFYYATSPLEEIFWKNLSRAISIY